MHNSDPLDGRLNLLLKKLTTHVTVQAQVPAAGPAIRISACDYNI